MSPKESNKRPRHSSDEYETPQEDYNNIIRLVNESLSLERRIFPRLDPFTKKLQNSKSNSKCTYSFDESINASDNDLDWLFDKVINDRFERT